MVLLYVDITCFTWAEIVNGFELTSANIPTTDLLMRKVIDKVNVGWSDISRSNCSDVIGLERVTSFIFLIVSFDLNN